MATATPPQLNVPNDPLPEGAIARMGTARFRTLSGHIAHSLSPDAKVFAFVAGRDEEIRFMDTTTGHVTGSVPLLDRDRPGGPHVYRLAFTPDGKRLAVIGGRNVTVLDLETGRAVARVMAKSDVDLPRHVCTTVSVSADGNRIAVGGRFRGPEAAIVVWDVPTNKAVATLKPIQNQEVSVALSADGKTLATWGRHRIPLGAPPPPAPEPERVAQLWDVDKQAERTRFEVTGHGSRSPFTATLSPDGKVLALIGSHRAVEFFDTATGKNIGNFPCKDGSLAFSPNGKWVALVGSSGPTQVFDLAGGKPIGDVESPVGLTDGLVFTATDRAVAYGLRAGALALWEVPSGKRLTPTIGHSSAVTSIVFAPDGRTVLSGAADRELLEWNPTAATLKAAPVPLPAGRSPMFGSVQKRGATVLSPDGSHVVVLNDLWHGTGGPTVFHRTSGKIVTTMAQGGMPYQAPPASFSADGNRLVVLATSTQAGKDEPAKLPVWDVASGRVVAEVPVTRGFEGTAAALSPDGTRLVTVASNRTDDNREFGFVHVVTGWDLKTGKKLGECARYGEYPYSLSATAVSNSVAVVISAGELWVVDYEQGRAGAILGRIAPAILPAFGGRVAPAFDADGKRFAVGVEIGDAAEFGVRVYDWPRGKVLHTFTGHRGPVTALAFAPDGKTLASGSADTTVLLWDLTKIDAK